MAEHVELNEFLLVDPSVRGAAWVEQGNRRVAYAGYNPLYAACATPRRMLGTRPPQLLRAVPRPRAAALPARTRSMANAQLAAPVQTVPASASLALDGPAAPHFRGCALNGTTRQITRTSRAQRDLSRCCFIHARRCLLPVREVRQAPRNEAALGHVYPDQRTFPGELVLGIQRIGWGYGLTPDFTLGPPTRTTNSSPIASTKGLFLGKINCS